MAVKDLPKSLGDAKDIRREFRQVAADERYLNSRWEELVQSHAGEWVAVFKGDLILSNNLRDLFEQAAAKGWDLGTMVVEHLASERRRVLLRSW